MLHSLPHGYGEGDLDAIANGTDPPAGIAPLADPRYASSPFPTRPGLVAAQPSAPPKAQRRCTLVVVWYALRFWIELGFKALKSLGWKWDKTRRTDPTRVSRHWLVLSVATLLAWPMAPEWKTPGIIVSHQATCGRHPKRWLPITGTFVLVRRAPSA